MLQVQGGSTRQQLYILKIQEDMMHEDAACYLIFSPVILYSHIH